MAANPDFLDDQRPRPWAPHGRHGFRAKGLFVGQGPNAIEEAVAEAERSPTAGALLDTWKHRRAGRAAPVLLVALHPEGAAVCGASGEEPPVYPRADLTQPMRRSQFGDTANNVTWVRLTLHRAELLELRSGLWISSTQPRGRKIAIFAFACPIHGARVEGDGLAERPAQPELTRVGLGVHSSIPDSKV